MSATVCNTNGSSGLMRIIDAHLPMTEDERIVQLPDLASHTNVIEVDHFDAPSDVRTFLIADIRGFTTFTHLHGDDAAAQLVRKFARISREAASDNGGRLSELRGDEALLVFGSPRAALRAAIVLQKRCAEETEADPDLPLEIGIGVDAGEAAEVEGGYRSGALNLAARLCALAHSGEIFSSEGVVHLARRTHGIDVADCGNATLKGLPEPIRVYQVAAEGELPESRRTFEASNDLNDQSAMIVGFVAEGFGVVGILASLLLGSLRHDLFLLIVAGIACLVGFGASQSTHGNGRGAALLLSFSAVGLVLAIGRFAIIAAPLCLIAAGMAYFGRSR